MGKKGKRSKRNAVMKQVDELFAEYEKLLKEALCDNRKLLYSKAANKLRKTIQLLESKNELKMYTLDKQLVVCYLLMSVEYERKNYKVAIDCYNYIVSKSRNKNFSFSASISLYYQLIMLRLNGQDYQISDFIHEISREKQERSFLFEDTVHAFRAQKQFDAAIRLEMTCGSLRCSTELKSKLSLALTYLEQYRIEFNQRSQMRKEKFFTMNSLITRMIVQFPLENNYSPEYCLVLAQWYYLTHTLDGNKSAEVESMQKSARVLDFLYQSLTVYTVEDNGIWEIVQDNCYTCGQAVTPTEVQLVCSGCRVACYCSIDHQRATWKKEAVQGTCIGHNILCPLYKAFRKNKLQIESKDRDEEKESKAKVRLERECVKFLEYGLCLKDKCFPCEYET